VLGPWCALLNSARHTPSGTLSRMTLNNVKLTLAVAYAIGVGGVAVATGVTTPAGLVVFGALALLPAAALVALWNDPQQTLSEAIQSQTARR
jgi:hypothetical protein